MGDHGALAAWRNRRSGAKRRAILKGAKRVFLASGFGGASMDAVAAAARVSKMTVYRHFGGKEDLFAGVIVELCDRIIGDDLSLSLDRPPAEVLSGYARRMVEILFAPETLELHRIVIAETRRFPALGRLFYDSGPEPCIAVLADYLERHQGDPRLAVGDPRRSAEEFLEVLRGYAHLRVLLGVETKPSAEELAERIDSAVRHLLA
jgi:TetR/AcrR family transcriptional repressor of mexJK operon